MSFSRNQIRHDIINLHKTLKLLEKTVNDEDWAHFTSSTQNAKWLKAQTVIGGVKHCRKVLATLPDGDYSLGVKDADLLVNDAFVDKTNQTLDRLEKVAVEANVVLQPQPRKLGLSSKLPKPRPKVVPTVNQVDVPGPEEASEGKRSIDDGDLTQQEESLAHNLLDPLESEQAPNTLPTNPTFTFLSPSAPSTSTSSTKATGTPALLKTSTALHDDLADQLAQMAKQLKRNAMHFSESLEKDKAVLKDTEEKLDVNYDSLGKERIRLRDHRGKSGGTTCLVIMSIIVVIISFAVMVLVIRIT